MCRRCRTNEEKIQGENKMFARAGDIVKIKVLGRVYWGRVTNYGFKFSFLQRIQEELYFVEIPEKPNWGALTVRPEQILDVYIPEEKVQFT
jgi:hypothetical protein